MNQQDRQNLFAELMGRHQGELYGYIYSVVRNWEDTDDLYQSVCLVLWSKLESFQQGTNFFAWARQTARNKIGNFLTSKRLPTYATEQLTNILAEGDPGFHDVDEEIYIVALRRCREKLTAEDEELLRLRYVEELSMVEIAERLQRLRQSVGRSLNRIRRWLLECIQMELARQERSSNELS
jgi:RNA polymerase sigma-70 factor, ECF subfamily